MPSNHKSNYFKIQTETAPLSTAETFGHFNSYSFKFNSGIRNHVHNRFDVKQTYCDNDYVRFRGGTAGSCPPPPPLLKKNSINAPPFLYMCPPPPLLKPKKKKKVSDSARLYPGCYVTPPPPPPPPPPPDVDGAPEKKCG